jgi:threonine dehydratase
MLEAVPDLDVLVVPVGGGGLVSGIAIAAKALRNDISIFGVETQNYPSMHQRLHDLPVECGGDTIAEGIAVKDVGDTAFQIIKALVEAGGKKNIERAIVALIEIEKTVAEGAGAAGLAALLEHRARFAGKRVGIPVCGGNIDSRLLSAVLMRGLVRDGRLVRLRVTMPDISGARVAGLIAEADGNIVEVQHQRVRRLRQVNRDRVLIRPATAPTPRRWRSLETNGQK